MCVYASMRECGHRLMAVHTWRCVSGVDPGLPSCWSQSLLLSPITLEASSRSSFLGSFTSHLIAGVLWLQSRDHIQLILGSRGLSLGPRIRAASILPTERSPHTLICVFNWFLTWLFCDLMLLILWNLIWGLLYASNCYEHLWIWCAILKKAYVLW